MKKEGRWKMKADGEIDVEKREERNHRVKGDGEESEMKRWNDTKLNCTC